MKKKW